MKYVSIIGENEELKQLLAEGLMAKGYSYNKALIETDEHTNDKFYRHVSTELFDKLIEHKMIISVELMGGVRYGTAEPVGSIEYVGMETEIGNKALKDRFGKQIVTVCVAKGERADNEITLNSYDEITQVIKEISMI